MSSNSTELMSILLKIRNIGSVRPVEALTLAKEQLLTILLADKASDSSFVRELISLSAEIAAAYIATKLPPEQRTIDVRQEPSLLETLYDLNSSHYRDDKQEAFVICLALACYFQNEIRQVSDAKRLLESQLHLIYPLFRSVCATYESCQYKYSIELADKNLNLLMQIDCDKWLQQIPELGDVLRTVEFHTIATKVKSLRELKEYSKANRLLNSIINHNSVSENLETYHGTQILQASILIHVNRMDEAQRILQELQHAKDLSSANRSEVESNLAVIRYYNEGDYRSGYTGILSGLSETEKSEFYKILDAEYSGVPTDAQMQRKEQLLVLAFSDERLAQLLASSGDRHLVHELINYKKHYVSPRMKSEASPPFKELFRQHKRAVNEQDSMEASRTLMLCGKAIEKSQRKPGDFHIKDMKDYICATIASNDINQYFTQSEYFAPILTNADAKSLKRISSTVEQFFLQLARLTNESSLTATPQRQRTETAMRRLVINCLLSLLAELTLKLPAQTKNWLLYIAELKQCWDFSGLKIQLQQHLLKYRELKTASDGQIIAELCESLAVKTRTHKQRQLQLSSLNKLNNMLLPLRTATTGQFASITNQLANELVILDFSAITTTDTNIVVTTVIKINQKWNRYYKSKFIDQREIEEFVTMLRPTHDGVSLSESQQITKLQHLGQEFTATLLPEKFFTKPPICVGLRSTGVLQDLPLEALTIKSLFGWCWFGALTTSATLTDTTDYPTFIEERLTVHNITIFANANFAPPLKPLNGSKKEANTIENMLTKSCIQATNLQGNQANRDRFLQLSGNDAPQILHIATHGIVDKEFNELSLMAFSNKDNSGKPVTPFIGFYDVCLMDLRKTDLVVLSTCSTHDGKPIMGESANSLAWGFKAAGVKAVIATRWQVNDEAAILFWAQFYTSLTTGKSISESLTEARKSLIYSTKWSHPKYWAAYHLIV